MNDEPVSKDGIGCNCQHFLFLSSLFVLVKMRDQVFTYGPRCHFAIRTLTTAIWQPTFPPTPPYPLTIAVHHYKKGLAGPTAGRWVSSG